MTLDRASENYTPSQGEVACADAGGLRFEQSLFHLKEKVTRYFEHWRNPVYRYLRAAFGPMVQAEEITQETFLQLYEYLNSGREIGNVRAWVFRVAHNLAIDQTRHEQFVAPLDERAWEEVCRAQRDAGPNPEQRLLQLEKLSRVNAGIARLTMTERQCLHLRAGGLRYREIAEIAGLSVSSVGETLYRVIQKLSREAQE